MCGFVRDEVDGSDLAWSLFRTDLLAHWELVSLKLYRYGWLNSLSRLVGF